MPAAFTRISVTHRLRGAASADRILVLEHGKLVEQGTHQELLRRNGLYTLLWQQENHQGEQEAAAAMELPGGELS